MDPELEALNKINEAIKDLQEDAKVRVVAWLINKYSIRSGQPVNNSTLQKSLPVVSTSDEDQVIEENDQLQSIASFATAAELLAKCNISSDTEKVLVVAAYIQVKNGGKDLTGYEINHTLKNIGYEVSNITAFITSLKERKPQFMVQTRKSGTSKQSKKSYRVTDEGIKEVERLLKNK